MRSPKLNSTPRSGAVVDTPGPNDSSLFNEDSFSHDADDHQATANHRSFLLLKQRIYSFDRELVGFSSEARQLGRSIELLLAVRDLREQLQRVLIAAEYNASQLFTTIPIPRRSTLQRRAAALDFRSPITREPADFSLAQELDKLLHLFRAFLSRADEFVEFTGNSIRQDPVIELFVNDLEIWIQSSSEYSSQTDSVDIRRFYHSLLVELGAHLSEATVSLKFYVTTELPTIMNAQKRSSKDMLTITTAAIFFSTVAATTLQVTYGLEPQTTDILNINTLLYASLIFSIGAALNSLLSLAWKQTIYGSRRNLLSRGVSLYFRAYPLLFLVISIVSFSAATVYLSWDSQQTYVTRLVTVIATGATMLGLLGAAALLIFERWINLNAVINHLSLPLHDAYENTEKFESSSVFSAESVMTCECPATRTPSGMKNPARKLRPLWERVKGTPHWLKRHSTAHGLPTNGLAALPTRFSEQQRPTLDSASDHAAVTARTSALRRWHAAVTKVMATNAAARPSPSPGGSKPGRNSSRGNVEYGLLTPGRKLKRNTEWHSLQTTVESFRIKYNFSTEQIEGIPLCQFSPVAYQLAVARPGPRQGVYLYSIEPSTQPERISRRGVVTQLAWSPDGAMIALQVTVHVPSAVTLCGEQYFIEVHRVSQGSSTQLVTTLKRDRAARQIVWTATGTGIFLVDRFCITKLVDLEKPTLVEQKHIFANLSLRSIAVDPFPLSPRLILLGKVVSPKGQEPKRSRAEKRIIVYNCATEVAEDCVPILDDVKAVQFSRTKREALISFEGKCAPQLWELRPVLTYGKHRCSTMKITLKQLFDSPEPSTSYTGSGFFAGGEEQFVASTATDGRIVFWQKDVAAYIHVINTGEITADIRCLSFCPESSGPHVLATASSGMVSVWETEVEPPIIGAEDAYNPPSHRSANTMLPPIDDDLTPEIPSALGITLLPDPCSPISPPFLQLTSPSTDNFNDAIHNSVDMITRWKVPLPLGFSRQVEEDSEFPPFTQMQVFELGSPEAPQLPGKLEQHDVDFDDWGRLMQDLSRLWAEGTPSPEPYARETAVLGLLIWWNISFFLKRGVELTLYIGPDPFTSSSTHPPPRRAELHDTSEVRDFAGVHDSSHKVVIPPVPRIVRAESVPRQQIRDLALLANGGLLLPP